MVNQTQRETPLFDGVCGEVTVIDPTHPLYGHTLPQLPVRMNRSTPHVMVLLPTGRRHAIPRAATNLDCSVEAAAPDSPLPTTSVRTILPLARLVQQLKQAKEESHAPCRANHIDQPPNGAVFPQFSRPSGIGFPRAASSNWRIWSPISFSVSKEQQKTRSRIMSVEILHVTPTTVQRAKMA